MFAQENYREILKDLVSDKPRGELARLAEFIDAAPAVLSQVFSGLRHLTFEQAILIAEYFKLSDVEKEYFLALIQRDRTSDEVSKKYWTEKIKSVKDVALSVGQKVKTQNVLDDMAKSKFYSSYLYSAVLLFCSLGNGKTVENVCEKFKVSRQYATDILNFLAEIKLVNVVNGKYSMSIQNTHVPKESTYVYNHHTNWRLKGLSHLAEVKESELSFTGPCSLDKKTFDELKVDILNLIENAYAKAHKAPAEELACLNIDFFWVDA